ncbi:FAD binding domain-containing protein [Georgenia sp. Z1491]|uniref:FAD binding domain-containing protein n=1 Tax=Georgenia sp. Z1491 TaxID=3416707 RepID=UPI003CEC79E6
MKPAPFDYVRASTVDDAIRTLDEADGDGKIIAGGQSLMPVLAMRMSRPSILVDVNRIPGLSTIDVRGDSVRIGALVRHVDLVRQDEVPLLSAAAKWIGHPAIRSRGTFGGSLAHADPSAELPVVVAALDGVIHVTGPDGARDIPASEMFVGTMESSLEELEMVTRVTLPLPELWGFTELSRRHGDFGLVTVCAATVDGSWRIAVGGVGGVPHRATGAERVLDEGTVTDERIDEAARAAADGIAIPDEDAPGARYSRAMTEQFTRRAVARAVASARTGG